MMRGRKPRPRARASTVDADSMPIPPDALPRCPAHLSNIARTEWRRLAGPLYRMGVLTVVDRSVFAAYCQAYARWVEAELKLKETPLLLKMPSGYVQQSPWLSISNKQLELMGRYMVELGLTPASRVRVVSLNPTGPEPIDKIELVVVYQDADGKRRERPLNAPNPPKTVEHQGGEPRRYEIDSRV